MKKGKMWKIVCVMTVFAVLIMKCRRAGEKEEE